MEEQKRNTSINNFATLLSDFEDVITQRESIRGEAKITIEVKDNCADALSRTRNSLRHALLNLYESALL